MIKLFSLKQQKKDGTDSNDRTGSHKKASAAQLRIQKGDSFSQPLGFSSFVWFFWNTFYRGGVNSTDREEWGPYPFVAVSLRLVLDLYSICTIALNAAKPHVSS